MSRHIIVKGDSIPDEYVREAVDKLHGILTNLRTRLDRASNGAHAAPERRGPKEPPLDYCAAWDNNRGAVCGNDLPCANHPAGPAQAREADVRRDAHEWAKLYGVTILDPDGWRVDNLPLETQITEADFKFRLGESTVQFSNRAYMRLLVGAAPTADRAAPAEDGVECAHVFNIGRIIGERCGTDKHHMWHEPGNTSPYGHRYIAPPEAAPAPAPADRTGELAQAAEWLDEYFNRHNARDVALIPARIQWATVRAALAAQEAKHG